MTWNTKLPKRLLVVALVIVANLLSTLLQVQFVFAQEQPAPEQKVPLQETDRIKLKYFGQKTGRVAFTYEENDQKDIFVLDFSDLSVSGLVVNPGLDEYPTWSPDGRRVAFYSDRTKNREIFAITDDGSELTQLTNSKELDEDPDWSPDGAYLTFRRELADGSNGIFVMNSDGSNIRRIAKDSRAISVPKWSPRGTEIIFTSSAYWPGWDVLLYEVNTDKKVVITNGIQSFTRPSWHPSGGSLLVSYGSGDDVDIHYLEKGAKAIVPLIKRPGKELDAIWIDDAQKILFVAEVQDPKTGSINKGKYEIFVWDRKTDKIEQVTESGGSIRHLSWTNLPSIRKLAERFVDQLRRN